MYEQEFIEESDFDELEAKKFYIRLKPYEVAVCRVDDVLNWKQQYHPLLSSGCIACSFFLVWLFDPSVISLVSGIGLTVTCVDFVLRTKTVRALRSPTSADQDEQFKLICYRLVKFRRMAISIARNLSSNRENQPHRHFMYCVAFFGSLAWIGSKVHNLLLIYIIVTVLVLLPGVKKNGFSGKYYQILVNRIRPQRIKIQ